MAIRSHKDWTRRDTLCGLAALLGAGVGGIPVRSAIAAAPLETTRIRLLYDPDVPILCQGPQYLAKEFLELEGFTDIHYEGFGDAVAEHDVLVDNRADIASGLASDLVVAIDSGEPIVVIAGLHAGCVEMFANDRVASIRDLAGKRIAVNAMGGPEQVFIASVIAYVGLDPTRDVEWAVEPSFKAWPDLLEAGEVDVVNAFPPQNLVLRERKVGHVILNTTLDDPWRHFFCCMISARQDFVRDNPVATKRVLRAFAKANQLCDLDRQGAAQRLVDWGVTDRYDYALTTLDEVPFGAWRTYDPNDTLRFFALRLREAGLVQNTPSAILERGTDFRFIDELRQELKT